ncbi:hypothetical protein SDC9_180674 [bioreactor metagenome]|uniref:Uncharacterized protein n=1 Tax=bioreactor metagenome TaxID=1076179 RepID=A0A645H3B9_9ZZZZ
MVQLIILPEPDSRESYITPEHIIMTKESGGQKLDHLTSIYRESPLLQLKRTSLLMYFIIMETLYQTLADINTVASHPASVMIMK